MSSTNSSIFKLSKKIFFFKKIYIYYNIYIRNFKFFFKPSQFGEDKKIIKLFKKKGTYLDIGCFHPVRQSNTFLMHKLEWRGINIDLNPLTIDLFNIARPKDTNICAAVSNKKENRNMYFHHELSSVNTLDKNHTLFLKKHFGIVDLKKKKIRTKTITEILLKLKIKNIDFLNIDIEGGELNVLKSINFKYFDIKVICVEIINYKSFHKKLKTDKSKIFKLLKKNKYSLKFKSSINYIFIKKNIRLAK